MKKNDIVLFGATSFVGQITAQYLDDFIVNTHNKNADTTKVTFAIAGRNKSKIDTLVQTLLDKDTPVIIADSDNLNSLREMVQSTKVIISTVGPYDLYGTDLVRICAEEGVHYCDLAGESHWIKQMIDKHGATAFNNGACIVPCCGFDSIPSDLGVYVLQQSAIEQYGEPCTEIDMRVKKSKGAVSGGTVASIINLVNKAKKDTKLRKSLKNPYQICPSSLSEDNQIQIHTRQHNIYKPIFETIYGFWTAPFIMSAINTKVVHRSNALQNYGYSAEFKYSEAVFTGKGRKGKIQAYTLTAGLATLMLGVGFEKTRKLLESHVLPKSGEGPSPKQQQQGFYNILFYGKTATGKTLSLQCKGDRDPGYGSTAKMLGQSALCLLQDLPEDYVGGFWTPASLFGNKLVTRLEQYSGVTFKII